MNKLIAPKESLEGGSPISPENSKPNEKDEEDEFADLQVQRVDTQQNMITEEPESPHPLKSK